MGSEYSLTDLVILILFAILGVILHFAVVIGEYINYQITIEKFVHPSINKSSIYDLPQQLLTNLREIRTSLDIRFIVLTADSHHLRLSDNLNLVLTSIFTLAKVVWCSTVI
jgi:hypothetical protein